MTVLSLLLTAACCGAWGADGMVTNADINPDAPDYMVQGTNLVLYVVLLIVFGVMIPWAIWHAKDNNLQPALLVFGSLVVVVVGLIIFVGQGAGANAYGGWSATDAGAESSYTWETYGRATGVATNFPSQAHAYDVQEGWALAGTIYFFRLLDIGFRYYIIPLVGIAGCLMAVWMSSRVRSARPLVVHVAAMIFTVPLYVLPLVQLNAPTDGNAMYALLLQTTASTDPGPGGTAPVAADAPRVSPFIACAFGVLTDLSERIGNRMAFGTRSPNSVLVQAGLDARLSNGDASAYLKYASFCMTAVKSMTDKKLNLPNQPEYQALYQGLLGNVNAVTPGGALGQFAKAPIGFRHALSPYADSMFRDLWVHRWVYMDMPDIFSNGDELAWYDKAYAVTGLPEPYSYHPTPWIGAGQVEQVTWNPGKKEINTLHANAKEMSAEFDLDYSPALSSPKNIYSSFKTSTGYYVPFCSVRGFIGDADTYASATSTGKLPASFLSEFTDVSDAAQWVPIAWDDVIRARITRQYLGVGSIDFCKGVSPDRQNEHLWGCLIAGRYRDTTTEQGKSMATIQDTFDAVVRPALAAQIDAAQDEASQNGGFPDERLAGVGAYSTGTTEIPANAWQFQVMRNAADLIMCAPGIQNQIGLYGDFRAPEKEKGNTNNWFFDMLVGVAGFIKPTVAGIFSWVAIALTKIAMMMYPHIIGLMTFIIIIKSVPYLVRGIFFGQYFYPFMHLLPGIALICIMPLFIQIGLSFCEQGNGMALPALMVRSSAGGDFGETLLQLVGSFFILSSFSLSATFLTLGFGSIAGILSSVNSTGFKLTGAGLAGTLALAGMAIAGTTGRVGGMLANSILGIGKKADEAGGDGNPGKLPAPAGPGSGSGAAGGRPGSAVGTGAAGAASVTGPTPGVAGSGGTAGRLGAGAELRTLPARPQTSTASRQGMEDISRQISSVGKASTRAIMNTAGALASTLSHGPEASHFAQGFGQGASATDHIHEALSTTARAADTILAPSGRSYRDQRDSSGELTGTTPAHEAASQEFAQVARTYEYQATLAERTGDSTTATAARGEAAGYYRDAGRLATTPAGAAVNQLRSAEGYLATGNYDEASKQLALAEANFRRAEDRATTPTAAGQAAAGLAQLHRLQIDHDRASGGGLVDGAGKAQRIEALGAEADRAELAFASSSRHLLERATAQGDTPGAWNDYAATSIARLQVAALAQEVTGAPALENLAEAQAIDLAAPAGGGNRQAQVVLGAMLAATGRREDGRDLLTASGLDLNDADLDALIADMKAGRTRALDSLMRRL